MTVTIQAAIPVPPLRQPGRPRRVRGSVLPIALILLLVLATAAVGFVRVINASSMVARNASFQRDAVNRNELALNQALRAFENVPGAPFALLANTDQSALGVVSGLAYSATALPTDSQGVPLVLKDEAAFAARFGAVLATTQIASGDGMTTLLVIDRLCTLEQPADASHCTLGGIRAPDLCSRCTAAASPAPPMFRVSARTNGPRGVEAYTQTLITLPFE
jgi:Tfp pilus assembly protein PilX